MAELVFSLLGPLQIGHPRLGAITLNNRKAIGLLAYLLIESDHAHSRAFLLGLLWPDLPTAAAQNNLRVTWAQLQKALRTNNSDAQPHLIGERLTVRDFMDSLRGAGVETGGAKPYGAREKQAFAGALDRVLSRARR